MNPLFAALLAGGGIGRATSALTKPWQYLNSIPWVGDVYRPQAALPLDYTAEARGGTDPNPEYLVEILPSGMGKTNRGRLLLPEDVRKFRSMGRDVADWGRRRAEVAAATPRTRGWQARITPGPPGLIAGNPGDDRRIGPDEEWALMRLAQAKQAGLVPNVPTPPDRDVAAAWRALSAVLAGQARREGFNLTRRLEG